jgi:GxxExxY protein
MVVDGKVVIENKSTAVLPDYTPRKTLNYLKASTLEVGLILHFGPTPKFYRIVQTLRPGSDHVGDGG